MDNKNAVTAKYSTTTPGPGARIETTGAPPQPEHHQRNIFLSN